MKKNLLYKLVMILLLIIVLILEILPYGAVLNFSSDGEELIRKTFSYFSLTPFGYANFGPLLTAISTVLLIMLMVLFVFKHSSIMFKVINHLLIFTFLISLLPLTQGVKGFSIIGLFISVILLIEYVLLTTFKRELHVEKT